VVIIILIINPYIQKFKLLSVMSETCESDTDTDGDDFLEERPGKHMKAEILQFCFKPLLPWNLFKLLKPHRHRT
jgi:hypothetical protein